MVRGIANSKIGFGDLILLLRYFFKLKVSTHPKNQRFNNKHFSYKIVWIDAQGMEVNPEGSIWKPIDLTGREVKTVQSLAPNPSAVDVVVYLKK